MFHNTFEHGYSDAVRGNQKVLGGKDYREGFDMGVRYMKKQKAIELVALGILTAMVTVVVLVWVTSSAAKVLV